MHNGLFTTGDVAKICAVSPRTVGKWFDSGRLRGFLVPGSRDRRIPRENLIGFLKENGMPLGDLECESGNASSLISVAYVGKDISALDFLPSERFSVVRYATTFLFATEFKERTPMAIVLDYGMLPDAETCRTSLVTGGFASRIALVGIGHIDFSCGELDSFMRLPLEPLMFQEDIERIVLRKHGVPVARAS